MNVLVESISNPMMIIFKSSIDLWSCYPIKRHRNVFCNFDVDDQVSQLTANIFCIMNAYFFYFIVTTLFNGYAWDEKWFDFKMQCRKMIAFEYDEYSKNGII